MYIENRFARSIRWGGVPMVYTVLRPYMYICRFSVLMECENVLRDDVGQSSNCTSQEQLPTTTTSTSTTTNNNDNDNDNNNTTTAITTTTATTATTLTANKTITTTTATTTTTTKLQQL